MSRDKRDLTGPFTFVVDLDRCRYVRAMATRCAIALTVLLASVISGCSTGDLNTGCGYGSPGAVGAVDLVGSYRGDNAGSVTLRSDFTFTATGLRVDGSPDQLSGAGAWKLRKRPTPSNTPDDGDIVLSFVPPVDGRSQWTRIFAGGSGPGEPIFLYYDVGGSGSCDLRQLSRTL